jgi:uncharacterized SAM-binding protein YcdF (DUF218 family)
LIRTLRFLFNSLMLAVTLLGIGFLVFVNGVDRDQKVPIGDADAIVVLTGGPARIDAAVDLLERGKAKRLLITGVYPATTREELKQITAADKELFACCIDIDRQARNTIDNAVETRQWLAQHRFDSVIVVTANYHMPRAMAELGRVLPSVTLIPYPVVDKNVHVDAWWAYPGTTKLLASEYVKYLPALGRLSATKLVRTVTPTPSTMAAGDSLEP